MSLRPPELFRANNPPLPGPRSPVHARERPLPWPPAPLAAREAFPLVNSPPLPGPRPRGALPAKNGGGSKTIDNISYSGLRSTDSPRKRTSGRQASNRAAPLGNLASAAA